MRPPRPLRAAAVAAALALVLWGFCRLHATMLATTGGDFNSFWGPPRAVRELSLSTVYPKRARTVAAQHNLARAIEAGDDLAVAAGINWAGGYAALPTPLLYTAAAPLARLPYRTALAIFRGVSLACLAAALLWLCLRLGYGLTPALLATGFLSTWYGPTTLDVATGNVNQLVLAGLVLAIALLSSGRREAPFAGGAALGLLCLFKPVVAPAVPLIALAWARDRRWRELGAAGAGLAAGGIAGLLAPALLFGSPVVWLDWYRHQAEQIASPLFTVRLGNLSTSMELWRRTGVSLAAPLALLLLVAAASALLRRRRAGDGAAPDRFRTTLHAAATGCLVYLLAGKVVWSHYLVLWIPALLLLAAPPADAQGRRGIDAGAIAATLLALATVPVYLTQGLGGRVMLVFGVAGTLLLYLLTLQPRLTTDR